MLISVLLPSDDTAPSEGASEHDLLNSDSEHSDEEELNPDDYSEDVSSPVAHEPFRVVFRLLPTYANIHA